MTHTLELLVLFFLFAIILAGAFCIKHYPTEVTRALLSLERRGSNLVRKTLKLEGDVEFAYLEGGQGEPLLLLHGFGGSKDNFNKVARYLTPHYRLIIPDILGFGESHHPNSLSLDLKTQIELLHQFLNKLEIGSVHICGNSMGAQLALLYAAKHRDGVKSLWLISPAGFWTAKRTNLVERFFTTGKNELGITNVGDLKRVMAISMVKPPRAPRFILEEITKERIRNKNKEDVLLKHIFGTSVESYIKGLPTKTLVVFGEQDRVIDLDAIRVIQDLMPNVVTKTLKDVGHIAMYEAPKTCAIDYIDFRYQLERATKKIQD